MFRTVFALAAVVLLMIFGSGNLMAQGDVGGTTGGTTGGGTPAVGGGGGGAGQGGVGVGGGTVGQGQSPTLDIDPVLDIGQESRVEFEDIRVQPFAGLTIEGLVHPYSAYVEGLASAAGTQGGAGRQAAGRGGAGGRTVGGIGGASNLVLVTRRSIRARLRNRIVRPAVPSSVRSTNFAARIARIPALQAAGANVSLNIVGSSARLVGNVPNADLRSLLERQARLEPGIYRISNEIKVVGQ
jgi:hypothetical protein